jgi:hypothetical protein
VADRCFYTVADSAYFLGAVALVNSLRLTGHADRVLVLDCGLGPEQRALLEPEADLVPAPAGPHPWFLKWLAALERPAEAMILLDSDIVVVRSLEAIAEQAAEGRAVAFVDLNPERYQEEWAELVGRPVERRPYVNSGFLAVGGATGVRLLERLHEAQQRVSRNAVAAPDGSVRRPFKYPDQDVLNAVLASELAADEVEVLERRLGAAQPFARLRLGDVRALDCRYPDGERPYLLHHLYAKPWLALTPTNPYTRLLPRLLLGEDVAVRPAARDVPLRLRPGSLGELARDALVVPRVANAARFKARLELRRAWARATARATSRRSDREGVAGAP